WHMKTIMPLIGRLTTGHAEPFKYLYQTAMTFLSPQAFQKRLARVGFMDVEFKQYLLGGIAIHTGQKSG
ncbi:class I SAM-dependent methyltransferase, partial [bacterium]|nr:class I SAM-dependent methyltransferase [bacterium]